MNNDPLDVIDVLVTLKCVLKKFVMLTEVYDSWTVVVGEHFVSKNCIGDLRSMDEACLKQTSL